MERTKGYCIKILSLMIIGAMLIPLLKLVKVNTVEAATTRTEIASFTQNGATVKFETDATSITQGDTINVYCKVTGDKAATFASSITVDNTVLDLPIKNQIILNNDENYELTYNKNSDSTLSVVMVYDGGEYTDMEICFPFKVTASATTTSINFYLDIDIENGNGISKSIDVTLPKPVVSHSVTYNYSENGGTSATKTTDTIAEGAAIDLTPTATKSGWTFVGWNTNKSATTKLNSLNMGTNNVTLYAIYKKTFKINYYDYNESATKITSPVTTEPIYNKDTSKNISLPRRTYSYKDSYGNTWIRNGWTQSTAISSTAGTSEGGTATISSDTNFYMLYYRNINISYDLNGGTGTTPATISKNIYVNTNNVTENGILGASVKIADGVQNPTKQGYTFAGWKVNNNVYIDSDTLLQSGSTQVFKDKATLIAKWTPGPANYTVKHYKQNGDGTYPTTPTYTETKSGISEQYTEAEAIASYADDGYQVPTNISRDLIKGDGSTVIEIKYPAKSFNYTVNHYKQQSDDSYSTITESETKQALLGAQIAYTSVSKESAYKGYKVNTTMTTPSTTVTKDGQAHIDIYYAARTDIPYTVKHYKQQGNGTYSSTPTATDSKTGTTGKQTSATARTEYANDGYQVPTTITQKTIAGDGSTVVEIRYPANSYNYTVNTYLENSDGTYPDIPISETKQALLGATITASSQSTSRTGYTFDSSRSTQGNITIVKDGNPEINLYYKRIKYTVTFDVNGGNALSDSERTQTIEYGNSYNTLPTPTKTSSSFAGWWTSKTGGTQVTGNEIVTSSHTLYAHWDAKQYTIIFNVNGGDELLANTKTVNYGETFGGTYSTMPVPTREGYTFEGWYTGVDTNGNVTGTRVSDSTVADDTYADSSDNINLYADWKVIKYTVTFDAAGGRLASTSDAQRQIDYGQVYGTLPADPSKEGHIFDGWFKQDGTQILATTPVTTTHTVYAHWTPEKYTVTYKNKNDDGTEATLYTATDVEYNTSSIYRGDTPTKQGDAQYSYTFNKWIYSDETDATTDLASVKHDMVVYPAFERSVNKYTVTFKNYDDTVLGTSEVEYGGTANYTGETPIKPSIIGHTYTFEKWMTALEDGVEDDLSNVVMDRDVYASYKDEGAKYTIKFNANSNGNTNVTVTPQTIQAEYDKVFGNSVNAVRPSTYPGHEFDYWYTQATGGTKIEDDAQLDATFASLADNTNTITVYAHWKNAKYTVTFDISNAPNNSGVTVNPTSKEVTFSEQYGELPTPSNWAGHPFLGWFTTANGTTKVTSSTSVTETKNHTLYARWDTDKIEIKFIGKVAQEGNEDAVETVLAIAKVNYGQNIVPSRLVDENGNSININDFKVDVVTPKYTYKVNENQAFTGDLTSIVTENREIYVNYNEPIINKYKVEFYDEDKTTYLGESEVDYGETANDSSANAQKPEDNACTYTFVEWTDANGIRDDLSNVIEDRKVYAKYEGTFKNYTVQFLDKDEIEVSKVTDAHYGDNIIVPDDREDYETAENKYKFVGWEDSEGNVLKAQDFNDKTVTGNMTFTAKYEAEKQKYKITFYYDTAKVQQLSISDAVEYGNSATYNGNIPTKEADRSYTYEFECWTDENGNVDDLGNVIADRDVYAKFKRTPIEYTIKYENLLATRNNPNPETYTAEDADIILQNLENRPGLKFLAWCSDSDLTEEITSIETARLENITIYAKWDIKSLMYFVKESADIDNQDDAVKVYDDYDVAKAYVDDLYNNRNIKNLGIYDLNNDLLYHPEKIYFIKDSADVENENAIQVDDFENAKEYVDELFAEGTITRIYDIFNKLVYEPKEEVPQIKYFVKVNNTDESTDLNTFDKFSDAKSKADELVATGVKVYDINGEVVYVPEEKNDLYLKTIKYKIGEQGSLKEYVKGDKCLYRIDPNISLNQFKQKLDSNGDITVYNKTGEKITDNDIIKTGMILKAEKDGNSIMLILSVKGDINGDGKVTATDLAAMNQQILKEINLEGESLLSADISDDNSTTATDLAAINQAILKELDLSAIN